MCTTSPMPKPPSLSTAPTTTSIRSRCRSTSRPASRPPPWTMC